MMQPVYRSAHKRLRARRLRAHSEKYRVPVRLAGWVRNARKLINQSGG